MRTQFWRGRRQCRAHDASRRPGGLFEEAEVLLDLLGAAAGFRDLVPARRGDAVGEDGDDALAAANGATGCGDVAQGIRERGRRKPEVAPQWPAGGSTTVRWGGEFSSTRDG
jgi:hypothetical protein